MSSLKSLLNKVVNTTITKTIGDLKSTAILRVTTFSSYDAEAGEMLEAYDTYTCECVKVDIKQDNQINFELLVKGDRMNIGLLTSAYRVLIPTAQLPATLDVNSIEDDLVLNGETYGINGIALDPSGSLYSFYVSSGGSQVSVD